MSERMMVGAAPLRVRAPWRGLAAFAVLAGAAAGWWLTPGADAAQAAADAGAELTRLLRMMAMVKLLLVAGAALLVRWRLRFPVRAGFAAGYLVALAAACAGPGLIWRMAHVGLGAAALHGGLALLLVLLWRDPGSPAMAPARWLGGRAAR